MRDPPPLDLTAGQPNTGTSIFEGGPLAAAQSLFSGEPDSDPDLRRSRDLLRKIERLGNLAADAAGRSEREAVARSDLAQALIQSLAARADAAARLRAQALNLYQKTARHLRGRGPQRLDRIIGLLGWPGQALVIARSGLWRASGESLRHKLFDLRAIATYTRGGADTTVPHRGLIDPAWYRAQAQSASRLTPLADFLVKGARRGLSPHPLFDPVYYARRNADALAATRLDPLTHFLRRGAGEGRDPHPLFSLGWYLAQRPDVAASGENALQHYLEIGWRLGASPHPLFDSDWYAAQVALGLPDMPPITHYLTEGWRKGPSPHPLFDAGWYRDQNPDVAESGEEPLSHFAAGGGREGRNPSAWFDCRSYMAARGAALADEANPLVDYLLGGAWRIGEARPGFMTSAYVAARPDVAASGMTPLEHWARAAGPPPAA